MNPRNRDLPRLLPRPDRATVANRFAAVFVGIMGLCVVGLFIYAIDFLM
jgi:hypothetical protein